TTYTATFTEDWAATQTKVIADIPATGDPTVLPELNKIDHVAYIIGYTDGTVRPMNSITRAEVTTIFFRLLNDESRAVYWSQSNPYSDVTDTSWYNNAVSTMTNAGIVRGYPDGSFRPDQPITRAEFVALATRFSEVIYDGGNSFTDVPENHWAARYIALAEQLGWISGYPDGSFRPDQPITRAEAMALTNRVLERAVEEEHMLPDMITWPDNTPDAWYYEAVQEATNSHIYTRIDKSVPDQNFNFEHWLEILQTPDWESLEKAWSAAYSK
ncbi:MAG: S-layer homology domain-containing protein, partial [Faecousia sp.]